MSKTGRSLTATEVAQHIGISRTTFYNMIARRKFSVPPILGTDPRRWSIESVDRWLDSDPNARRVDEAPLASGRFIQARSEQDVTFLNENNTFEFREPAENEPYARYVRPSEIVEIQFMDTGPNGGEHFAKAVLTTGEKVWVNTHAAQSITQGEWQ